MIAQNYLLYKNNLSCILTKDTKKNTNTISKVFLICLILLSNSVNAENAEVMSSGLVSVDESAILDCSKINIEATRLACYDSITKGEHFDRDHKKQIDLHKTIKSALSGKPKIIVDNDTNLTKSVHSFVEIDEKRRLLRDSYPLDDKLEDKDNNLKGIEEEIYNKNSHNEGSEKHSVKNYSDFNADRHKNNLLHKSKLYQILSTKFDKQFLSDGSDGDFDKSSYSPLSLAYDLDKDSEIGLWKPRAHNPVYLLPLYMHDNPNLHPGTPTQKTVDYTQSDIRSTELKFQFSLKSKVAQDLFNTDADLWFGYTQQSHWQVFNEDNSRPFRATDYMPELFLTQPVKGDLPFGGKLRMLGAGAVHHSNGEDDPLSRSWNRIYFMSGAEWGKLTVMPRLWKRVYTGGAKNDNPDIEDYYGYGDLKVYYDLDNGKSIASTFRYNPKTSKGSTEIDYIYPMDNNVHLYMNLFHGYGESIIDYNHKDTAFAIGVMLNDWRNL